MLNRYSSCGAPVTSRNSLLSSPLLGAANSSQAMAPRNGGVTNDAATSARMVGVNGMSVRATSQPIGAATAQQTTDELTAMMKVVISGSTKAGSLNSRPKLSSVNAPERSIRLYPTIHDSGRMTSRQSSAANAYRVGCDRSSRAGPPLMRSESAMVTWLHPSVCHHRAAAHRRDPVIHLL